MQSYRKHKSVLGCQLHTLAELILKEVGSDSPLASRSSGSSVSSLSCNRRQQRVQAKISTLIKEACFPDSFIALLLQTALTDDGQPQHIALYNWLLSHVYAGNVNRLYRDWLEVRSNGCTRVKRKSA